MQTDRFFMDPACSPDTWLLWIGPKQYGSVCIHSSSGAIKQLEYRDFDLYGTDVFVRHAAELFSDRAAIQKICVSFRLNDWCWTPTAFTSEKEAVKKWISPFWPDRFGHRWVADGSGPLEATAWVLTPDHIRDQLHHLCQTVEYKHASGFTPSAGTRESSCLQIARLKDECWVSINRSGAFLYGQPHRVESEGDLLYLLSQLVDRFELDWSVLDIHLSGQWESDSKLLDTLHDRTERISFLECPWSFDGPLHWYTPLYDLYTCG